MEDNTNIESIKGDRSMTQGFVAQYASEAALQIDGVLSLVPSFAVALKEKAGVVHEGKGVRVVFGDTGMEFPDTYQCVKEIKERCKAAGVEFLTAKAPFSPSDSWREFGPPARYRRSKGRRPRPFLPGGYGPGRRIGRMPVSCARPAGRRTCPAGHR